MKKILVISMLILGLLACSAESEDNGGQGADFDSSMYYTKAEIDENINELVGIAFENSRPDEQDLAGSGWDNRTVTGWEVPARASYVLLRITVSNSSGATQRLPLRFATAVDALGDGGFDQNVPVTVNEYQQVTYYHFMTMSGGGDGEMAYAWYDETMNEAIPAGEFPAGFTVTVVPIWINTR